TRGGKQVVRVRREEKETPFSARPFGGEKDASPRIGEVVPHLSHPADVIRPGSHPAADKLLDGSSNQVRQLALLEAHSSAVRALVFSPDGKTLVSAGGELGDHPGEIMLWKPDTSHVPATETLLSRSFSVTAKDKSAVLTAVFSPGGKTLATG